MELILEIERRTYEVSNSGATEWSKQPTSYTTFDRNSHVRQAASSPRSRSFGQVLKDFSDTFKRSEKRRKTYPGVVDDKLEGERGSMNRSMDTIESDDDPSTNRQTKFKSSFRKKMALFKNFFQSKSQNDVIDDAKIHRRTASLPSVHMVDDADRRGTWDGSQTVDRPKRKDMIIPVAKSPGNNILSIDAETLDSCGADTDIVLSLDKHIKLTSWHALVDRDSNNQDTARYNCITTNTCSSGHIHADIAPRNTVLNADIAPKNANTYSGMDSNRKNFNVEHSLCNGSVVQDNNACTNLTDDRTNKINSFPVDKNGNQAAYRSPRRSTSVAPCLEDLPEADYYMLEQASYCNQVLQTNKQHSDGQVDDNRVIVSNNPEDLSYIPLQTSVESLYYHQELPIMSNVHTSVSVDIPSVQNMSNGVRYDQNANVIKQERIRKKSGVLPRPSNLKLYRDLPEVDMALNRAEHVINDSKDVSASELKAISTGKSAAFNQDQQPAVAVGREECLKCKCSVEDGPFTVCTEGAECKYSNSMSTTSDSREVRRKRSRRKKSDTESSIHSDQVSLSDDHDIRFYMESKVKEVLDGKSYDPVYVTTWCKQISNAVRDRFKRHGDIKRKVIVSTHIGAKQTVADNAHVSVKCEHDIGTDKFITVALEGGDLYVWVTMLLVEY